MKTTLNELKRMIENSVDHILTDNGEFDPNGGGGYKPYYGFSDGENNEANPDTVCVVDPKTGEEIIYWNYTTAASVPVPFGYNENDGGLYIGEQGMPHWEIEQQEKCRFKPENRGRLWQGGRFITFWELIPEKAAMFIQLFKEQYEMDISSSILLYENNVSSYNEEGVEVWGIEIMAVRLRDFAVGNDGIPFLDFINSKQQKEINPWDKMPGNSDAEKRENWYAWQGKRIDEAYNNDEYFSVATPDSIRIYNPHGEKLFTFDWSSHKGNPRPFVYSSFYDKIYMGDICDTHSHILMKNHKKDVPTLAKGRFYDDGKIITFWGPFDRRKIARCVRRLKKQCGIDATVCTFLYELSDPNVGFYAAAVNLGDYLKGAMGVPAERYYDRNKNDKGPLVKFADMNNPDDCDFMRRERMNAWYGRQVDESKLLKEDSANPDHVNILDDNGEKYIIDWYYTHTQDGPIPFGFDDYGGLCIGKIGEGHSDLCKRYDSQIYESGRFWQKGEYITVWGSGESKRTFLKKVADAFQEQYNLSIMDCIYLHEKKNEKTEVWEVLAVKVKDYINGVDGVPFDKYLQQKSIAQRNINPWDKMPGDDDFERRNNWYEWNGKRVDEQTIRKMVQKSLNKTIKGGRQ